MTPKPILLASLLLAPLSLSAQTISPFPWSGFGPVDSAYSLIIDTSVAFKGRNSLLLYSQQTASASTWIASHQVVDAHAYRGRRVRIQAHMRTVGATAAGIWVVVDGFAAEKSATLVSDSLVPPLQGTVHWREVSLVFDVPRGATCIRYGSILHGVGQAWLDAIAFEPVSSAVPTTVRAMVPKPFEGHDTVADHCRAMIPAPADLDFEQVPQ